MSVNAATRDYEMTRRDFERVRSMIYARAGISLAPGKQDMVYSRLARRLRALGLESFSDYLDRLERDSGSDEWESFTNALTTNLTSFFRESHHFDILSQDMAASRSRPYRIWCSAASTGEEPYSLAITAAERFGSKPPVQIVATDIDTQVLETAQRGVYPLDRVARMEPARLKSFFRRGVGANEGQCRVVDELRALIEFMPLNLLDSQWGVQGPFDAIFCRNVMIYFDKPTQYRILERYLPLLKADGKLFAGHSESFFHAANLFRPCGRTVYVRARPA